MKFGIFFSYWSDDWCGDYCYYVKKAKSIGADCLEISAPQLLEMSDAQLKELGDLAAAEEIEIDANLGPAREYDVSSKDPEVRKAGLAFYERLFQAMLKMNCHKLIGALYSCWPPDFSDPDKETLWKNGVESLKIMGKRAQELGIVLCLEVVNRFDGMILNTAEEAVRFVDEVNCPAVKIHLDTFHMNIEEENMGDAIRKVGKQRLGHFHTGECNRMVPGKGRMPWREIGLALREIGYEKCCIMEPFVLMGGVVGQDVKVWRDLSNGATEAELDRDAKNALQFQRYIFDGK